MTKATTRALALQGADWLAPMTAQHCGVLVYIHGGSFLFGPSPLVMALMKELARASNLALVMPAYRLAPEHPCPAAVHDIAAFFKALGRSGLDPKSIFLAGEQTGANLVLAALQQNAGSAGTGKTAFAPAAMVFFSPWLDLTLSSWSTLINRLGISHTHSREFIDLVVRLYLGKGRRALMADNPLASPLLGPLAGLPPTMVHASESDISLDDSRQFSDQIEITGAPVSLHVWPRVNHMWERYAHAYCTRSIAITSAFFDQTLNP